MQQNQHSKNLEEVEPESVINRHGRFGVIETDGSLLEGCGGTRLEEGVFIEVEKIGNAYYKKPRVERFYSTQTREQQGVAAYDEMTKSSYTEDLYARTAASLISRFTDSVKNECQILGMDYPDQMDLEKFVIWFQVKSLDWKYATLRLYRSSLIHWCQQAHTHEIYSLEDCERAIHQLRKTKKSSGKDTSNEQNKSIFDSDVNEKESSDVKPSERTVNEINGSLNKKAKKIKQEDFDILVDYILQQNARGKESVIMEAIEKRSTRNPRNTFNYMAAKALVTAVVTGMRPSELLDAKIIPPEIDGNVRFLVKNRKTTNNRSHGNFREIELEGGNTLSKIAKSFVQQNSILVKSSDRLGDVISRMNDSIDGIFASIFKPMRRSIPDYVLYSGRNQFIANIKSDDSFSKEELSYLVGHNSDETAELHYAKASYAWKKGSGKYQPGKVEKTGMVNTIKRDQGPQISMDFKPADGM